MVNAVREELSRDVLAKTGALRTRVNQHLGRDDLSSANIRVALEQIPWTVIRATVLREIAQGAFHPKEEVVLAELFAAVEQHEGAGRAGTRVALPSRSAPALVGSVVDVQRDKHRESEAERREPAEEHRPVSPAPCPRTMKRRLNRLEHMAKNKDWKILEWIKRTRDKLKHLLPAARSNTYPSTTNEIERFFRALTRFYKTRCGFYSVQSAKREMIFFMVAYLFSIQAESGKAPIEKILPEANTMPLYRLLNYPFASETASHPPLNVKPVEEMATESVEEVG